MGFRRDFTGNFPLLDLRVAFNGNANFYAFNGSVYFVASDQVNGYELWKTDVPKAEQSL